jgi:hypothetical protein
MLNGRPTGLPRQSWSDRLAVLIAFCVVSVIALPMVILAPLLPTGAGFVLLLAIAQALGHH